MSCAMLNAMVLSMDGSWNEAAQMSKAHPVLEMQAPSKRKAEMLDIVDIYNLLL